MADLSELERRRRELVKSHADLAHLHATVTTRTSPSAGMLVSGQASPSWKCSQVDSGPPGEQPTATPGLIDSDAAAADTSHVGTIPSVQKRPRSLAYSQQRLPANVDVPPSKSLTRLAALVGDITFNPRDHESAGPGGHERRSTNDCPDIRESGSLEMLQPAHHAPLSHPRWTDGRSVSAMRWLPDLPQVLLSAHIPSRGAGDSHMVSDGVVAVWDVEHATLTRALLDTAPVTSLAVHPLSPSLVMAGTAYGRVLTWDTRSRTPTPCSSASCGSVSVIRSLEPAHGSSPFVLSACENGTVCVWALASLEAPFESVVARERGVRDLRISAMRIPSSAVFAHSSEARSLGKRAVFCFASDDGGVYRADNANDRWLVHHGTARHDCSITRIACHPGHPRYHLLADVLITTSMDWSVGLWSFGRRGPGLRLARFSTNSMNTTRDAEWSPSHPGVFAVGDDGGGVSVFDISRPHSTKLVGRYDAHVFESGHPKRQGAFCKVGVNRLQWNPSGSILAAGDKNGLVFLWSVPEALANPDDLAWENTSSQIKHWRTQAAAAVPTVREIANAKSYVFKGIPPLFNPIHSEK